MAFKKIDNDLGKADSGALGLANYLLTRNLVAINTQRPRKGHLVYNISDPWRIGGVEEKAGCVWLPISPESSKVRLKLYGNVRYGDIKLGGAATLGRSASGPEATVQTLSPGVQMSDWIEIDLTERQQNPPPGGGRLTEVQIRVQSVATATAFTNLALFNGGFLPVDLGGFFGLNGRLLGGFDYYDVIGVTPKVSSKVLEGFTENSFQVIRSNTATASGNDIYLYYPYRDVGELDASHVDMTRYSQMDVYSILWEEVITEPFPSIDRSMFPIENQEDKYTSICPGTQGNAGRLAELYEGLVHIMAHRTPVYCTQAKTNAALDSTHGWLEATHLMHCFHAEFNHGYSDQWIPLSRAAIGQQEQFSGAGGISERTAVDVLVALHILNQRDPGGEVQFKTRLRSFTVDADSDEVDSHVGPEIEHTLPSVPNGSYTGRTLGFRDKTHQRTGANPEIGSGQVKDRNNLQGLWPLSQVGQTGVVTLSFRLNDPDGLAGKTVVLEVQPPSTPRQGFSIVVSAFVVVGAEGREWGLIGT